MARRDDGALMALFEITGTVPPLAGLALALGSYLLLHWAAGQAWGQVAPDMKAAGVAISSLISAVLRAGQYVLPAIFVLGALASATTRVVARRTPKARSSPSEPGEDAGARGPRNEHDIYRLWAGDWDEAPAVAATVDVSSWSLPLLRALEWKRFEEVCAAYFRLLGFETRLAAPGPDGGIDIRLIPEGAQKAGILVQCKAWNTYDVGVKSIRELLGVMAAQHVSEGLFVTTGRFTHAARDFAAGREILLIDGPDMLDKILALRAEQQSALLALATSGDFMRPTCPSCGVKMMRRIARASGDPFWGCQNFPGCRTTLRIAAEAAAF